MTALFKESPTDGEANTKKIKSKAGIPKINMATAKRRRARIVKTKAFLGGVLSRA